MGPPVFKTGERQILSLAGSIPVRLRYRSGSPARPDAISPPDGSAATPAATIPARQTTAPALWDERCTGGRIVGAVYRQAHSSD